MAPRAAGATARATPADRNGAKQAVDEVAGRDCPVARGGEREKLGHQERDSLSLRSYGLIRPKRALTDLHSGFLITSV